MPVNHPGTVVLLGDELAAATLDTGMAIVLGIEAAKRTAWDVRDLETLAPTSTFPSRGVRALFRARRRPHRRARLPSLRGRRCRCCAPQNRRPRAELVQIHADELRPERAADACKQLREQSVNVGVARRVTHRWAITYLTPGRSSHPGTSGMSSPPIRATPSKLLSRWRYGGAEDVRVQFPAESRLVAPVSLKHSPSDTAGETALHVIPFRCLHAGLSGLGAR